MGDLTDYQNQENRVILDILIKAGLLNILALISLSFVLAEHVCYTYMKLKMLDNYVNYLFQRMNINLTDAKMIICNPNSPSCWPNGLIINTNYTTTMVTLYIVTLLVCIRHARLQQMTHISML